MHDVFFDDARIVNLLRPGRNTVIVALEKDNLFSVCIGACAHNGSACDVIAVFGKKCPISTFNRIDQQISKVNHYRRRRRCTVALFSLFSRRLINIGVAVAQDIRAVGTHIIDIAVAVDIPEIASLCVVSE